jgi:hypothetical protein
MTFRFGGIYSSTPLARARQAGRVSDDERSLRGVDRVRVGDVPPLVRPVLDIHWTNGDAQFGNYQLECTVL